MDEDTDDGAVPSGPPQTNGDGSPATDVVDGDSPASAPTPAHAVSHGRLRAYLRPEESLRTVTRGRLLDDPQGPAVVGVTDDRFVAVTDAGSVLSAGFDRVRSVRCHTATLPTVRGVDARLCFAVGFLAALVGFLGVLATATSPLTPALTFLAAGAAMLVTHVRYGGVSVEPAPEAPEFLTSLSRRVRDWFVDGPVEFDARRDWIRTRVGETRLQPWVWSDALALSLGLAISLALVALVESGFAAPLFAVATAGGASLVVFGFYHGRTFDRLALDWRRERTVTAALEDGTTVTIRTDTDSDLDRLIATRVGKSSGANRAERSGRWSKRDRGDSRSSTPSGDLDRS